MAKEQTLSIVKPDAVGKNHIGEILARFEKAGLQIVAAKMLHMSKEQAEQFYAVHKERPFFNELVEFVTSAPVIVMALYKENAVTAWRELIGATDPAKAAEGTIRNSFGTNVGNNAVHGSDSVETALQELELFFPDLFEYNYSDDENEDDEDNEEDDECCGKNGDNCEDECDDEC